MSHKLDEHEILSMINALDEKLDLLSKATQESFTILGMDTMKLAVQAVSTYRVLIENNLTTEEDFKIVFTEVASSMRSVADEANDDDLSDIVV